MASRALKIRTLTRIGLAAAVIAGTVACDENGDFSLGPVTDPVSDGVAAMASDGLLVERDVEAPDVFSVTDQGLWDGRPSLGGVWVAHPDVSDPERVIIRNTANDRTVIGALFRRERENPGPPLQLSSDAAEELGVLAGAPADLSVIALRREEAPAITAPSPSEAPDLAGMTDDLADEAAGVAPDAAADAQAALGALTSGGDAVTSDSTSNAAPTVTATASSTAPALGAGGLEKPYVQIGIFSIEANANRTAERLRADGLSTRVLAQQSQGRAFWRVIVGPAPTTGDRAAILNKVKALGFSDAYFVTN